MATVTAVLEHSGTHYTVTQDSWDVERYDDAEDMRNGVRYMWEEGNYSCDCNRLLFISYEYDDYPGDEDEDGGFPCGSTVNLVSLHIEGDPTCVMCNGTGKDFDCSQLSETIIVPCRSFPCPYCGGTGQAESSANHLPITDGATDERGAGGTITETQ